MHHNQTPSFLSWDTCNMGISSWTAEILAFPITQQECIYKWIFLDATNMNDISRTTQSILLEMLLLAKWPLKTSTMVNQSQFK